jgi:hypothetical protein
VLQTCENLSVQDHMLMQEQIDESSKTWHVLLAGDDSVLSSALPSSRQFFDLPRVVCATDCKARDEPLGKISAVTATQTGPLQAAEQQPDVYKLSSSVLSAAGDSVSAEAAMSASEATSLSSRLNETPLRDDSYKRELRSSLRLVVMSRRKFREQTLLQASIDTTESAADVSQSVAIQHM